MNLVCPECNAAHQVDIPDLDEKGASFECTQCHHSFLVQKEIPESVGASPSSLETETASGDSSTSDDIMPDELDLDDEEDDDIEVDEDKLLEELLGDSLDDEDNFGLTEDDDNTGSTRETSGNVDNIIDNFIQEEDPTPVEISQPPSEHQEKPEEETFEPVLDQGSPDTTPVLETARDEGIDESFEDELNKILEENPEEPEDESSTLDAFQEDVPQTAEPVEEDALDQIWDEAVEEGNLDPAENQEPEPSMNAHEDDPKLDTFPETEEPANSMSEETKVKEEGQDSDADLPTETFEEQDNLNQEMEEEAAEDSAEAADESKKSEENDEDDDEDEEEDADEGSAVAESSAVEEENKEGEGEGEGEDDGDDDEDEDEEEDADEGSAVAESSAVEEENEEGEGEEEREGEDDGDGRDEDDGDEDDGDEDDGDEDDDDVDYVEEEDEKEEPRRKIGPIPIPSSTLGKVLMFGTLFALAATGAGIYFGVQTFMPPEIAKYLPFPKEEPTENEIPLPPAVEVDQFPPQGEKAKPVKSEPPAEVLSTENTESAKPEKSEPETSSQPSSGQKPTEGVPEIAEGKPGTQPEPDDKQSSENVSKALETALSSEGAAKTSQDPNADLLSALAPTDNTITLSTIMPVAYNINDIRILSFNLDIVLDNEKSAKVLREALPVYEKIMMETVEKFLANKFYNDILYVRENLQKKLHTAFNKSLQGGRIKKTKFKDFLVQ